MPQLDIITFFSQTFWLFVFFGSFYWLSFKFLVVPMAYTLKVRAFLLKNNKVGVSSSGIEKGLNFCAKQNNQIEILYTQLKGQSQLGLESFLYLFWVKNSLDLVLEDEFEGLFVQKIVGRFF